jgi:hypothetical protein
MPNNRSRLRVMPRVAHAGSRFGWLSRAFNIGAGCGIADAKMRKSTIKQIQLVKRLMLEEHPTEDSRVTVWKKVTGRSRARFYVIQRLALSANDEFGAGRNVSI